MSNSNSAVPVYVELAVAASQPAPGTAGSILRSYLSILATYLARRGESPDITIINTALSNLPGLMLQNRTQTHNDITTTPAGLVEGLATLLAAGWSAPVSPAAMLPLSRPLIDHLGGAAAPTSENKSFETPLIVLQRPPSSTPTLDCVTLRLGLREDTNTPKPSCALSLESSRTTYTVIEEYTGNILKFIGDMAQQGLVASIEGNPGYLAVPVS